MHAALRASANSSSSATPVLERTRDLGRSCSGRARRTASAATGAIEITPTCCVPVSSTSAWSAAGASLLARTIFAHTNTGLPRWWLAAYLVTSRKGRSPPSSCSGSSSSAATSSPGAGCTSAAGQVRPDRERLAGRVPADESYVGCLRTRKLGRGAVGKTLVVGAVEAARAGGRRLGRLRLAALPYASAVSLEAFLGAAVATPAAVSTDCWSVYAGLAVGGTTTSRSSSSPPLRRARCWASTSSSASPPAGCWARTTAGHLLLLPGCLDEHVFPFKRRSTSASATASPGSSCRPAAPGQSLTGPSSPRPPRRKVVERCFASILTAAYHMLKDGT